MNISDRSLCLASGFVKQAGLLPLENVYNFVRSGLHKDFLNAVNSEGLYSSLGQHLPKNLLRGAALGTLLGSGSLGLHAAIKGYRAAEGGFKNRLKAGLDSGLRGAAQGGKLGLGAGTLAGLIEGIDAASGDYMNRAKNVLNSVGPYLNTGAEIKELNSKIPTLLEAMHVNADDGGSIGELVSNYNSAVLKSNSANKLLNEQWKKIHDSPYASRTLFEKEYPGLLSKSDWGIR